MSSLLLSRRGLCALGTLALGCVLPASVMAQASTCPTTFSFYESIRTTPTGGGFNGKTNQYRLRSGAAEFRMESFTVGADGGFNGWSYEVNTNTTGAPTHSNPVVLGTLGTKTLFSAKDSAYGTELWITDGSAGGTMMLKDINPGTASSSPLYCGTFGSKILFSAFVVGQGRELWATNGTDTGTVLVKDIYPGLGNANPGRIGSTKAWAVMGGVLYFAANGGFSQGYTELWRSDGTSSGTYLIKDIYVGSGSSSPILLVTLGTKVLFRARDASGGTELWKTEGTAATTVLVKDIWPGTGHSYPWELTVLGTSILFRARADNISGYELWKSDGSAGGTSMVKDIWPGSGSSIPRYLYAHGGEVYFAASPSSAVGSELFKTNGTAAGTVLVKDINAGYSYSHSYPQGFFSAAGTLFFRASKSSAGYELYKTNGTAAGTSLVKDINPGYPSSSPSFIGDLGSKVLFSATNTSNGRELWVSDGSTGGTTLLKDINPGFAHSSPFFAPAAGGGWIGAATNGTNGRELWKTDGTAGGTVIVKDVWPNSGLVGMRGLRITRTDGGTFNLSSLYMYGQVAVGQLSDFNTGAGSWTLFDNTGYWWRTISFGSQYENVREIYLVDPNAAGGTTMSNYWDNIRLQVPAVFSPSNSQIWATKTVISSFGGETVIQVRPRTNCNGTLGAGHNVVIETGAGILLGGVVDLGNGVYTQTLRATTASTGAVVRARVDGVLMTRTASITFVPVDPALSEITVSPSKTVPTGTPVVTVIPKDDQGNKVGTGFTVRLSTYWYYASPQGTMSDNSDGTYTQSVYARNFGTALIGATVNGLPLDDRASLTILNPANLGKVVGLDSKSYPYPFSSIQEAVDESKAKGLRRILILPQTYNEVVLLKKKRDLTLEGIQGVAKILGLHIQKCQDLLLSRLEIDASITEGPLRNGIDMKPNNRKVTFANVSVHSAGQNRHGIVIQPNNRDIEIRYCQIRNNARNGLWLASDSGPIMVRNSDIRGNGWSGAYVANSARATFLSNTIAVNGNPAIPKLVKDINPGFYGSNPSLITPFGDGVVFQANAGSSGGGAELWRSDGTASGTAMIKDLVPGFYGSYPANFTPVGEQVYFTARTSSYYLSSELWKTDGTAAGTNLVKDIYAGFSGSNPSGLTPLGSQLFFSANDGTHGVELWTSDGTNGGTVLVKDINPGSMTSTPGFFTALGDTMLFRANDGTSGLELWKTDGTAAGTMLVKDFYPGLTYGMSNATQPVAFKGHVYMRARDTAHGWELWKTDGTTAGTVMLKDLFTGIGSSFPYDFKVVGNLLFFRASDGVHGIELWRTDGTATGTFMIKDIYTGSGGSTPNDLAILNGELLFEARTPTAGWELWKTDGTAAGTVLVKDIWSGYSSSQPSYMATMGAHVYFSANDGSTGYELWRSDGTTAGTELVGNLRPDTSWYGLSSYPAFLTPSNGTLYFQANDGSYGAELWKFEESDSKGEHVKGGYGIWRERVTGDEINPKWLTLIHNIFGVNGGEEIVGQSSTNVGNYDQILDTTDTQTNY